MHALQRLSIVDCIVLVYLGLLAVAAGNAVGSERDAALQYQVGMFLLYLASVILARVESLDPRLRAVVHRVGFALAFGVAYGRLRPLLHMQPSPLIDDALLAWDLNAFGVTPARWIESGVGPLLTEWFSVFYLGYFVMVVGYAAAFVFAARHAQPLGEGSMMLVLVMAIGHITYFVMPAIGPLYAYPNLFAAPLPDGAAYRAVTAVVEAAGPQRDAFPSLHTGAAVAIAMFAARQRKHAVMRHTWAFTVFAAVQIVIATIVLRFHYAIDVFVGAALGALALPVAAVVSRLEDARRARLGLGPTWPMPSVADSIRATGEAAIEMGAGPAEVGEPALESHAARVTND